MTGQPLLEIKDLRTYFYTDEGVVKAVDEVNLQLEKGEVLGLVGESGSGKSVMALSLMRLLPHPGKIVSGEIYLDKENLLLQSDDKMRKIRGKEVSMIFQDPTSCLNPVLTIGRQIEETIKLHQRVDKSELKEKAASLLEEVGMSDPIARLHSYPHQLSGGMRQRVMIAMALSCHPKLLIADEPTTNLDVTIQAQVLELMKLLKKDFSSLLLITHDLGVIAEMADKVAVMYAGKLMEYADAKTLFREQLHPYTEALLKSIPRIDKDVKSLHIIPGMIPEPIDPPTGCRFHPRCEYAKEICKLKIPDYAEVEPGHYLSCVRADDLL